MRKKKISDPFLWQKPPCNQKMKVKRQHKEAIKTAITQRLCTNLISCSNYVVSRMRKKKISDPSLSQKSPCHQKMKVKRQHKEAIKTALTQLLCTNLISCSNYCHQTSVGNPVCGIPTVRLTANAVLLKRHSIKIWK